MNRFCTALCAAAVASPALAANVGIDPSSAPWLGFMNVYDLGGNFQFASPWGVGDLVAQFDDGSNTLTMLPNQIGDPNEYWYQGGRPGEDPGNPNDNGGPGAAGNKIMEANLYQQTEGGLLGGQTVNFSGSLSSLSFTDHEVRVFIRDFAADFSSVNENIVLLTNPGAFSISLNTINDASRHVQWGIQVKGVNVWSTDIAPFGSAVFATIPTPATAALLGLGGLIATRRRRA